MKKSEVKQLIKEWVLENKEILKENSEKYMFFQNLETIKKAVDEMLSLNPDEVDAILANGHDWASDHISTSKDDVQEVRDFLLNNRAPMDEKLKGGQKKLDVNEIRKLVNQVINEGPYDEIDFGFLDQEDQEKAALWTKASEELYNKMAKDSDILKEIYRIFIDMPDAFSAKAKFKDSQYYNRVENYMGELYRNAEYRKKFGDGQLLKICETTFDKFWHDAYEAAKKRHERSQMGEELKGGQKKLDVAEPKGKITKADFDALRAMKKKK